MNTNCVLKPAIDGGLTKYKSENRGKQDAIVEVDESESGSKVGKAVASAEIGLDMVDWDQSQEMEAFMSYPYTIKDTIEHAGICTEHIIAGKLTFIMVSFPLGNFPKSQTRFPFIGMFFVMVLNFYAIPQKYRLYPSQSFTF